jgi:hypothetical protein
MNSTPLLFKGRAVSSQHAGGADLTTVAYNSDGSTSVTDARGNVHGYGFSTQFGLVKPTARESRARRGSARAHRRARRVPPRGHPTLGIRNVKVRATGGFRTWTEDEIAQFEVAHPVSSRARLAFALAARRVRRQSATLRSRPMRSAKSSITTFFANLSLSNK